MDENIWKLPPLKKELWRCSSSSSSSSSRRSPISLSCCSSSSSSSSLNIQNSLFSRNKMNMHKSTATRFALPRSFSSKSHSSSSSLCYNNNTDSPLLKRSSSVKCSLTRSLSRKGCKIARKCSCLAKEQRARFYIIKRCVSMLICWNKHSGFDF